MFTTHTDTKKKKKVTGGGRRASNGHGRDGWPKMATTGEGGCRPQTLGGKKQRNTGRKAKKKKANRPAV